MRSLLVLVLAQAPMLASAQARYRVEATPLLVVTAFGEDGLARFGAATWATRLASGGIAVADGGEFAVRVFDPSGRLARSFGRRGEGPGEFQALSWIGQCFGDSLVVWDERSARVSVVSPQTGIARSWTALEARGTVGAACSTHRRIALFAGAAMRRDGPPGETGRTSQGGEYAIAKLSAQVHVFDATGGLTWRIDHVPQGEMIIGRLAAAGGQGAIPRPLGATASVAFLDSTLVVGASDLEGMILRGPDARVLDTIRIPAGGAAATPEMYERAIEVIVAAAPAPLRDRIGSFARAVPPPRRLPAFSRTLVDPEGLIWVVVSSPGASATVLRAYRTGGDHVATLEMPLSVTVFEIGRDYILGRTEDEDGAERIQLLRLHRR